MIEALGFDDRVAEFPGALGGLGGGLDGVGGVFGESGVVGAVGDAAGAGDVEGAFGLVLADEAGLGEELVGIDVVAAQLAEVVLNGTIIGSVEYNISGESDF